MQTAGKRDRVHEQRVGDVEHRRRMQIAYILRMSEGGPHTKSVIAMVMMGQHHALGTPAGAPGEKNAGDVIAAPAAIGEWCVLGQQGFQIIGPATQA